MPKIKRSQLAIFLNVEPGTDSPVWALIGNGVTEQTINYNPQTSEEIYIHEDSATTDVESYKPTIPTPMTAQTGEAVFEYVDGLRRMRAVGDDARTEICIVYLYDKDTSGAYPAEKNACSVQIDDFGGAGGESSKINFTINMIGDAVQGTFNPSSKTFTEAEAA